VEVAVSENVLSFLDNLGYTCDFRFEQDGTESVAFFNDRSYIITVTKCISGGQSSTELEAIGENVLIEISTRCSDQDVNSAADQLAAFAELFSP